MLPPVLILAGGQGTRAREYLGDTPKFLAPIRDTTLGDLLLNYLYKQGVTKVILSLSGENNADKIFKHVVQKHEYRNMVTSFSIPNKQLGILESIKYASEHYKDTENLIVINGDTLLKLNLPESVDSHLKFGFDSSWIQCFGPLGLISHSGVTIYSRKGLDNLEHHNSSPLAALQGSFLDIGTREGWEKAQTWPNS